MTLNELKNEVASLGFESDIDIDGLFITCANRALRMIASAVPMTETLRVYEDDLPDGNIDSTDWVRLELKSRLDDFVKLISQPTDADGNTIIGAEEDNGSLIIPRSCKLPLLIKYQRMPKRLTAEDRDRQIDVTRQTEHLLPLLTASFLWLDDDSEKSQYYMALYQSMINGIGSAGRGASDLSYRTNGWA